MMNEFWHDKRNRVALRLMRRKAFLTPAAATRLEQLMKAGIAHPYFGGALKFGHANVWRQDTMERITAAEFNQLVEQRAI